MAELFGCAMLLDKNNAMLHCLQTNILGQRIHNCLLSEMSNIKGIYTYFSCAGNRENYFVQSCVDQGSKRE